VDATLRERQAMLAPSVIDLAWKAQHRLHAPYQRLIARGKSPPTAVGRELLGIIWAIGFAVERGSSMAA
jgi:transposase